MGTFNPIVCPLPAALQSIPDTDCPVQFDQIIGLAFYRKAGGKPFTATTITTSAAWTAAMAKTDNGKVGLTPAFSGMTIPESEITLEGENDNSTIGGLGVIVGGNVTRPKGIFRNKSAASMKAARSYTAESSNASAPLIAMYMINLYGQVIGNSDGSGFDVTNIAISDVYSNGLKQNNMHSIAFSLPYGWSDDFAMFSPAFDLKALMPK